MKLEQLHDVLGDAKIPQFHPPELRGGLGRASQPGVGQIGADGRQAMTRMVFLELIMPSKIQTLGQALVSTRFDQPIIGLNDLK